MNVRMRMLCGGAAKMSPVRSSMKGMLMGLCYSWEEVRHWLYNIRG